MSVQPRTCILIVLLTVFNLSDELFPESLERPGSPERSSHGKLINKEYWRPPTRQTDGPICDAEAVTQHIPDAHRSCKTECMALSKRAEIVFLMYGDSRSGARTVSRQCSCFTDGQCKNSFLGLFPICWCHAKNFKQMAFVCRNVILDWYRILINAKTLAKKYYGTSIKPHLAKMSRTDSTSVALFLNDVKSQAVGFWNTAIKPRLPIELGGDDLSMHNMPMHTPSPMQGTSTPGTPMHGVQRRGTPIHGVQRRGTPIHGVQRRGAPMHDGMSMRTPMVGMSTPGTAMHNMQRRGTPIHGVQRRGAPMYDGMSTPGTAMHDVQRHGAPMRDGMSMRPPMQGMSTPDTAMQGQSDECTQGLDQGYFEELDSWPPRRRTPGGLSGTHSTQPGTPDGLTDEDYDPQFQEQLLSEDFESESWPPQTVTPSGQEGAKLPKSITPKGRVDEAMYRGHQQQYQPGKFGSKPLPPQTRMPAGQRGLDFPQYRGQARK